MADLNGLNTEMDAGNLFEEKIVSDRKIGTIRVMTPVKDDGTRDESRIASVLKFQLLFMPQ